MDVKPEKDSEQDVPMYNVPGFLTKLWLLVEDEETNELIRWGPLADSFIVQNQTRFAKEVLPMFFKHKNMASFVRQLNMYGFRKRTNPEHGSLLGDHDDIEFQHPNFLKGKRNLLENIKRKVSSRDDPKLKMEDMHQILSDVQEMKGKQENITGTLQDIQRENEILWREVVFLRQRHEKQQKIVNRLIQFLMTMVNPVGLKRKQQLMLEPSSDQTKPKCAKFASTSDNLQPVQTTPYDMDLDTMPHISPSSPAVLSDVTHTAAADTTQPLSTPCVETPKPQSSGLVLDQIPATLDPSLFELDIPPMTPDTTSPFITSPASIGGSTAPLTPPSAVASPAMFADSGWSLPESGVENNDDMHNILAKEDSGQFGVGGQMVYPGMQTVNSSSVPMSRAVMKRAMSHEEKRGEIGEHVNSVQDNLEIIQNLLTFNSPSVAYNLDMESLMDIFNTEDTDNSNITDLFPVLGNSQNGNEEKSNDDQDNIKGNEVVQYVGPLGAAFTVEDEDSLLRSLNDDAAALARPCQGVAPSTSLLKK